MKVAVGKKSSRGGEGRGEVIGSLDPVTNGKVLCPIFMVDRSEIQNWKLMLPK